MICSVSFVFFFKQKTAYEMRISDWSSDVCSSDLGGEFTFLDRWQRPVEIYTAQIHLQVFFKSFDADFGQDSLVEFIIHILRFRSGLRNVKIHPRDEFQTIRRTSEFFQTTLDEIGRAHV